MKRLVGTITPPVNAPDIHFYKIDNKPGFYDDDDKRHSMKDLENLAVCINSPWSQTEEKYTIKVNCKDSYTKIEDGNPIFVCKYTVVGYECITTDIYGYGDTPEEALKDCVKLFKTLQKRYNKDNERF